MEISMESINNSVSNPKLRTFKLFKNQYKLETYLMSNKKLKPHAVIISFQNQFP